MGVVISRCSSVCTKLCRVPLVRLDKQLTATQHVYKLMARTCLYGYWRMRQVYCYTCISSYHLYLCLEYALERQKRHITITDLEATGLHGIAAHCNCIFYQIFLCFTICKFTLRILIWRVKRTAHACVNSGHQVLLSDFFWSSSTWERG